MRPWWIFAVVHWGLSSVPSRHHGGGTGPVRGSNCRRRARCPVLGMGASPANRFIRMGSAGFCESIRPGRQPGNPPEDGDNGAGGGEAGEKRSVVVEDLGHANNESDESHGDRNAERQDQSAGKELSERPHNGVLRSEVGD